MVKDTVDENRDSPQFQQARVQNIVSQLAPDAQVYFDFPNVKFKIMDAATGKRRTHNSREWQCVSELADEPNESLRAHIKGLLSRKR